MYKNRNKQGKSTAAATTHTITVPETAAFMWIEVTNASGGALSTFALAVTGCDGSTPTTVADETADFTTTLPDPLYGASTDMTVLANNTTGALRLDVRGLLTVKLTASAAVSIKWGC